MKIKLTPSWSYAQSTLRRATETVGHPCRKLQVNKSQKV